MRASELQITKREREKKRRRREQHPPWQLQTPLRTRARAALFNDIIRKSAPHLRAPRGSSPLSSMSVYIRIYTCARRIVIYDRKKIFYHNKRFGMRRRVREREREANESHIHTQSRFHEFSVYGVTIIRSVNVVHSTRAQPPMHRGVYIMTALRAITLALVGLFSISRDKVCDGRERE